jgi:multisubunit Na+/H+ antiporter MnhE subunit
MDKDFASLLSFSQSLSQWAVGILGGSVALLLSTSNWRPRKLWIRLLYFLFLPAWALLLLSLKMAVDVQQNVLAFSRLVKPDVHATLIELNNNLYFQIHYLQNALAFLCSWLVAYLFWWIFGREQNDLTKKG